MSKRLKTVTEEMVEEFLCPGCVCGGNIECGVYKDPAERGAPHGGCEAHVLGTTIMPGFIKVALGLPKGFCRPTWCHRDDRPENKMFVRLWPDPLSVGDLWNELNVPVWGLEKDGYLFVRTLSPRNGWLFTDVIKGGTLDLAQQAIDVAPFHAEID